MILIITALQISIVIFTAGMNCEADTEITRTCEPIRIDICRGIGYNVTGMPNFVGHDLQQDALLQLQTFTPLVQYGCSSRLRFFLCSVYVPMCTEKVPQPIGPCRPLCESVQELCEPVLLEFGFLWPPALNCSQFPPVNNEKHMCMEGPEKEEQKHHLRDRRPFRPSVSRNPGVFVSRPRYHQTGRSRGPSRDLCKYLRYSDHYYYTNSTGRCAAECRADILYSRENKDFAEVWVAVWAGLCFASTLFTLITFLADSSQFRYPERIIVILSGCYNVYSIGFLIRLVASREEVACYVDPQYGEALLIQGGLDNINCNIVFMLLYFFGMASAVWWVLLTFNWFLTAGLRYSSEVLERCSTYFHLIAWVLPSVKTITILVLRSVDADELTGMCYVGNQDPQTLMRFVIIPSFTYLVIGVIFLLAGMFSIFRTKSHRHLEPTESKAEKLEVLMVRIGIFALLYTVPATCVLVANFYEYSSRDQWLLVNFFARPNVEIFTLKIFMSLVVGITTGMWLWTSRTPFTTWKSMRRKCTMRQQTVRVYQPQKHIIVMDNGIPQKLRVKGSVTVL